MEPSNSVEPTTFSTFNYTLSADFINFLNRTKFREDNEVTRNIIVIIGYALIIVISLCGNLIVCKVAFGRKARKKMTNILIANLAIADLATTVFNLPLNVARFLLENWPFGSFLCIGVPFVQVTCVYVSTLTMAVIGFHRWWSVTRTKPASSSKNSYTFVVLTLLSIWLLSAALAVPHSIFNKVVAGLENEMYRCRVIYPQFESINVRLWLSFEAFFTQYVIPLSFTCVFYIKIAVVIYHQGKMLDQTSTDTRRHKKYLEAKRRRLFMLALVVLVFAICWFPLNLYHILADAGAIGHNFVVFLLCHWFAMSSVVYNPFIYCWLNTSFRKAAKKFVLAVTCNKCRYSNSHHQVIPNNIDNKTTAETGVLITITENRSHVKESSI